MAVLAAIILVTGDDIIPLTWGLLIKRLNDSLKLFQLLIPIIQLNIMHPLSYP